jgi:hypothetical protein
MSLAAWMLGSRRDTPPRNSYQRNIRCLATGAIGNPASCLLDILSDAFHGATGSQQSRSGHNDQYDSSFHNFGNSVSETQEARCCQSVFS